MNILHTISLSQKIKKGHDEIHRALERFPAGKIAVAWTGGKDSTLLVWLVLNVVRKYGFSIPSMLFINEGDIFPEIASFVDIWKKKWHLTVHSVQNDDILKRVKKLGDIISVSTLSRPNKQALKELGYDKKTFPFYPESLVGNHLMKTVPMREYIRKHGIEALITGIRWDEQPARSKEHYFSSRQNPDHTRIHPLLHFTERDVWDAIRLHDIPTVSLYKKGYRSLGAKSSTYKADDKPAWEQNFSTIKERAGRQQDKEQIMEKLRKLGYM